MFSTQSLRNTLKNALFEAQMNNNNCNNQNRRFMNNDSDLNNIVREVAREQLDQIEREERRNNNNGRNWDRNWDREDNFNRDNEVYFDDEIVDSVARRVDACLDDNNLDMDEECIRMMVELVLQCYNQVMDNNDLDNNNRRYMNPGNNNWRRQREQNQRLRRQRDQDNWNRRCGNNNYNNGNRFGRDQNQNRDQPMCGANPNFGNGDRQFFGEVEEELLRKVAMVCDEVAEINESCDDIDELLLDIMEVMCVADNRLRRGQNNNNNRREREQRDREDFMNRREQRERENEFFHRRYNNNNQFNRRFGRF
ncbi:hypothetical protein HDU76_003666 [Blyttiomyces sp. JEL0837]|nr:hypothetical protein HDU76_003666 [Blyttiomyces sp. JEL0837]